MPSTVTAVVTCHNYAPFVAAAVESALVQDYPAALVDVVVVDDGSTDGSSDVLAELAAQHPERLTVITQENAGYPAASARGFAAARGEIVALLDADDRWHPDHVRARAERFSGRPEVLMVYGDMRLVDAADRVLVESLFLERGMHPATGGGTLGTLLNTNLATSSSIAIRREVLDRALPIPPGVSYVDWWLAFIAARHGAVDCVAAADTDYRQHGANMTLASSGERLRREILRTYTQRRTMTADLADGELGALEALVVADAVPATARAVADMHGGELPGVDADAATRACARGFAALAAGEPDAAGVPLLHALAAHPGSEDASRLAAALAAAAPGHPLAGAREQVVLARLAELLDAPALLAGYAARHRADEPRTLAVWAPEGELEDALPRLESLAADIGLDEPGACDVLVVGGPQTAAVRRQLAARSEAVLTRDPAVAAAFGLPRYSV